MKNIITFQQPLRQRLPEVIGNIDYTKFRETLERIEEIIELGDLDKIVGCYAVDVAEREAQQACKEQEVDYEGMSHAWQVRILKTGRQALRCGIARHLIDEAYRPFSCRLADSSLLQHFCRLDTLGPIRVPSKSTLERYEKMIPEGLIREIIRQLVTAAAMPAVNAAAQPLGLEEEIDLDEYFLDSTCLKANIHFPVDWVLLRDATRTLMKAVNIIRREGLKNRMYEPAEFIKQMNKLCIQMSQTRGNRREGKRMRKMILRLMKKLIKKIRVHAERHKRLLESCWEQTNLSEGQAKQILKRMDKVLRQLPQAIRQAHERIIGERLVKNEDKILSLYEEDMHVIVRGKAGSAVEFGNTLLLGEQADGIILDWKLYQDQAPADSKMLRDSLQRLSDTYDGYQPQWVTSDRGFYSSANRRYLERAGIQDGMCPKSVTMLKDRLQDEQFCSHQRRRAQTEARIGILKNDFLGKPLRSKGYVSRDLSVAWAVLAHNLWVVARLPRAAEKERREAG